MMLKAVENVQVVVIGGAAGCLPCDTEVLTPTGWKRIDECDNNDVIAQYSTEDDSIEFIKVKDYIKLPCNTFKKIQGKGFGMSLTEEHTVLYKPDYEYGYRTISWGDALDRHSKSRTKGWSGKIKTSLSSIKNGKGLDISEGELRLQIAVMADGRIVKGGANNYTQIRFSKDRKYERLIRLCREFNLPHKDNGCKPSKQYLNGRSYEVIVFPKYRLKHFSELFYQCSQEQLDIIVDEITHWDGCKTDEGSLRYFSKNKCDADFVQYAFATKGYNTSIYSHHREGKSAEYTVNGNISGRGFRSFANKDGKLPIQEVVSEDGYKYCFTTNTGFFVVRQNGQIFITGNSGKSYILQLVPLLFADDPRTQCLMLRRTTPQITGQGGIWDTAKGIYYNLPKEARPRIRDRALEAIFPNFQTGTCDGMKVKYSHCQLESDKHNFQGLQLTVIGVDEATQFEWSQLEYFMSRLRSESSYFSRIIMSCNPDPEHKIKELISWHLDEDGYPIPERDGVVRYFIRRDGDFIWGSTKEELEEIYGKGCRPLSFTFVSATIYDNPIMMETNPDYLAFLEGLDPVNKAQLLHGNWNVKAQGNNYFKRENLVKVTELPAKLTLARGWDLASQEVTAQNKTYDFSCGIKLGKCPQGYYYLLGDYIKENYDELLDEYGRFRKRVGERDRIITQQAYHDGPDCVVVLPVDPGAAGKTAFECMAKRFIDDGVRVQKDPTPTNKNKLTRFAPFADAVEAGLVRVYTPSFDTKSFNSLCEELEKFDGARSSAGRRDDRVDAVATAFNYLSQARVVPITSRNQTHQDTPVKDVMNEYSRVTKL